MKIKVESLSETPLVLSASEPITEYSVLSAMVAEGSCTFLAPLRIEVTVAREFDHIRMHGQVTTRVRHTCSRCLVSFDRDLVSSFTVFYAKSTKVSEDEEVALTEEDLVTASYDGDCIDFTHEIEEQVLLEIPYKPLCSEECKGLCVKCGADLNTGECGCDRSGTGFTFSALKNLTVKR